MGRRTPLIVDLRDPWSDQTGAWRDSTLLGWVASPLVHRLESVVFGVAHFIVANTEAFAGRLGARIRPDKIRWIPNGVDRERLPQTFENPFAGLSIAYVGTLYGSRDLGPILRGFRAFLDQHPEARSAGSKLRIAGTIERSPAAQLRAQLAATDLHDHVEVFGVLAPIGALDLLIRSRLSVVLAQYQNYQIPAKLYESVGMGKPTLVIAEPDSATAREAVRLGTYLCAPDDVERITTVMEEVWRSNAHAHRALDGVGYDRLVVEMDALLRDAIQGRAVPVTT